MEIGGWPAVLVYIEADFTTNKDVWFVIKYADVEHEGEDEDEDEAYAVEGTYTYSYPDIKVTTDDEINFEGKFSSKDQFSANIRVAVSGDKTVVVFHKIK